MPSPKIGAKPFRSQPVRFQTIGPFLLAGLRQHFTPENRDRIADLWHEVGAQWEKLPARVGKIAYGACLSISEDNVECDYLAGTEVSNVRALPPGWTHVWISFQRYAIFPHEGHVTDLGATIKDAFQSWGPSSGYLPIPGGGDQPDFLERYGEGYDPVSGMDDIEVWLPVKN